MAKQRDKSVRYHNRVAKKYDAIYDDAYWRFHDEVTWHAVKPHLPTDANARCLDLGCGTGKWGLKAQKSGYSVTFVDHAPAMVGEVRGKLDALGGRAAGCEAVVADIADMPAVPSEAFALTLAMGDPLSICSDPARAAAEMFRCCAAGGVVIATADNRLAAADAYFARGDAAGLEALLKTGRTRWVTGAESEQFELHTFSPGELRKLFRARRLRGAARRRQDDLAGARGPAAFGRRRPADLPPARAAGSRVAKGPAARGAGRATCRSSPGGRSWTRIPRIERIYTGSREEKGPEADSEAEASAF